MIIAFSWIHVTVLLQGLMWTVVLSLISFVFGGLLGFATALMRISSNPLVAWPVASYVTLVQGTPVLILMFVIYFGLPVFGIDVSSLMAASIGMTLFSGAFLGEMWRGALQAVPRTQWEAADCLALSYWQRMWLIILPQAVRIATPPTVGFMVQIVKSTSLASVIGMAEMTYVGKLINASTFQPFTTYLIIAAFYFAVCYPLSIWSRKLERIYSVGSR